MSEEEENDEGRPCLHCMMVELIDQSFAEYPASGDADTIDTDEVITAIAKVVAELTCSQDRTIRQQITEKLMREIMDYDAEKAIGPTAVLTRMDGDETCRKGTIIAA